MNKLSKLFLGAACIFSGISFLNTKIESKAENDPNYIGETSISKAECWCIDGDNSESLWLYLTNTDYPNLDGDGSCQTLINKDLTFYYNDFLNQFKLYDKDDKLITSSYLSVTLNKYTRHPLLAFRLSNFKDCVRVEIEKGFKFPTYSYISGQSASTTYYSLTDKTILTRTSFNHSDSYGDTFAIRTKKDVSTRIDFYDELVSDSGLVDFGDFSEGGKIPCTWLHMPLNLVNMKQNYTTQTYFNDHANDFPIDLMSYIELNGKTFRQIVNENAAKPYSEQYSLIAGSMKGVYAPVYVQLINDPGMKYGQRIVIMISNEYCAHSDINIVFKPFEGWYTVNDSEVYLSKPVYFSYKGDAVKRVAAIQFGDDIVLGEIGGTLSNNEIPSAGISIIEDDTYEYGYVWKILGTDPAEYFTSSTIITDGMVCVSEEVRQLRKYEVIYKDEDGNKINELSEKIANGSEYCLQDAPYKKGYTSQWILISQNVEVNNNSFIMPKEDVTFKLLYTPNTYNLVLKIENSEVIYQTIEVTYDMEISNLPEVPEKEGSLDSAWYIDDVKITQETIYQYDSDQIAVARYDMPVFVVTFTFNDEIISTQEVIYGEYVSIPDDPVNGDLAFDGWYENNDKVDLNEPIKSDMNLVAKFLDSITISFDSDGGSVIDNQIIGSGNKIELPPTPTKTGYAFDGWYVNGNKWDFNNPVTSDMLLTAHWVKVESSGCKGNIISTSMLLSIISLIGVTLISKRKHY